MGKYKVEITETYQHQEIIEAKNEEDAISILKRKYRNEELILNEENPQAVCRLWRISQAKT